MTKKHWIILIILAAAVVIGLALYFMLRPTVYHSERIDPRTLHASPVHQDMLIGLWQSDDHVFYRFKADSTGCTWDTNDDLTEAEASPFEWEAYEEAVMIAHKIRLGGIVPKYYSIDVLNVFDFRFHDAYSSYALERVEEEDPLEASNSESEDLGDENPTELIVE